MILDKMLHMQKYFLMKEIFEKWLLAQVGAHFAPWVVCGWHDAIFFDYVGSSTEVGIGRIHEVGFIVFGVPGGWM